MKKRDQYIARKVLRSYQFLLDLYRGDEIDVVRQARCLTPFGLRYFLDAVRCYIAGQQAGGDELATKSHEFLSLAHAIGEKSKHDYIPKLDEAMRSSALLYVSWLRSCEVGSDVLEDARTNLRSYYKRQRKLDPVDLRIMSPTLLYTESYDLVMELADRLMAENQRKATRLFTDVLRIAAVPSNTERYPEKERLRKKIPKQLMTWIDRGHYGHVAYVLYSVFPRPDGPPFRLLEECWRHIPEDLIPESDGD